MNRTRRLAVALLLAGVAVARDRKADDKAAKAELKKPEGSWKASSAEMGGQELKPGAIERVRSEGG